MAVFRVCLLAALGLPSLALPVAAVAQTPAYHAVIKIPWNRKPSGGDMMKAYPVAAMRANRGGTAVMECLLTPLGGVDDCRVLAESELGFGEASLKIAPKFGFDTRKMAPESLAGAVATIPIYWLPSSGSSAAMPSYLAGKYPLLLTPSKTGKVACPTQTNPDQRCDIHDLFWDKSPSLQDTAPLVRTIQDGPAATAVLCSVRADFQLGPCETVGSATAEQIAAMDQMVGLFTAQPLAIDKTPVTSGQILLRFHWQVMRHAIDASHFSLPPKP